MCAGQLLKVIRMPYFLAVTSASFELSHGIQTIFKIADTDSKAFCIQLCMMSASLFNMFALHEKGKYETQRRCVRYNTNDFQPRDECD